MKYYSVKVNGEEWYYGPSARDAMAHVITASEKNEKVDARMAPTWGIQVQCCAGVGFHSSDCPAVRS